MTIPQIKSGTYLVIRVNGHEEDVEERPTIDRIQRAIGATCLDTVCLRKSRDGQAEIVMCVDDSGMIDGKPVNPKATELYHSICKPATIFSIHGDVVVCNDGDFA